MVKISVIIPVYNVEDYICETLESLIQQTVFNDIEVLMIDDGSTDDSRYIIEKYAIRYDNFHAFHKENEGQGSARNYGLTLAKGEYINFMDADDYLVPDAYEKLLSLAQDNDIISGNLLRYKRYNTWDSFLFLNSYYKLNQDIYSTNLNETPFMIWDTSICNKLYRKEFLNEHNIRFLDEKIVYEDLLFSFTSYILAESIAITPDIIYYWRVRSNRSSTSQQVYNIQNLKDRTKIIKHCIKLIDKCSLNNEISCQQYEKWLTNDFKVHLRRINEFPLEGIPVALEEINTILKVIPDKIKDNLNSYLKILYKMVEEIDVDGLLNFAHLERELKLNPIIPDNLDEKYVKYIDFEKDAKKEKLKAEVFDIDGDEENLFLEFKENINYHFEDDHHKTEAFLIYDSVEYPLEVRDIEKKIIVLPSDLIMDMDQFNIKIIYKTDLYEWESLLISKNRFSYQFDNSDVDICKTHNHLLVIDIVKKNNNKIEIVEVNFDGVNFIVKGISKYKISKMFIKNVLDFNTYFYDVEYVDDNEFVIIIPYKDILSGVVKKWELNSNDSPNSIEIKDNLKFFTKHSATLFTNSRNKILISNDILNPVDDLSELFYKQESLKKQLKEIKEERKELKREKCQLTRENTKLTNEVNYLNNCVEEYKARKVVRLADKLKFK